MMEKDEQGETLGLEEERRERPPSINSFLVEFNEVLFSVFFSF